MSELPPKASLYLVNQDEPPAGLPPDLTNIKYMALFNQVLLSCRTLEQLCGSVEDNSRLIRQFLKKLG